MNWIDPPCNIHSRLTDAANLEAQPEDEFFERLLQIGLLSIAYSKAKARADTRNAHYRSNREGPKAGKPHSSPPPEEELDEIVAALLRRRA